MRKNCWWWIVIAVILGWTVGWIWRGKLCTNEIIPVAPQEAKIGTNPPPDADNVIVGMTNLTISAMTLERSVGGTPAGQISLSGNPAPPAGNDGIHPINRVEDLVAAAALAGDLDPSLTWLAFPVDSNDKIQLSLTGFAAIDAGILGVVKNPQIVSCTLKPGSTTNFLVAISGTIGTNAVTGNIETTSNTDAVTLTRWLAAARGATATSTITRGQLTLEAGPPMKATFTYFLTQ